MRLVADANVLLSAVIGGRAALALRHDKVGQVLTPAAAYDEVFEYLPSLAKKSDLSWTRCFLLTPLSPLPSWNARNTNRSFRPLDAASASAILTTSMCSPSRSR